MEDEVHAHNVTVEPVLVAVVVPRDPAVWVSVPPGEEVPAASSAVAHDEDEEENRHELRDTVFVG